jgi:agmatine deiminase
MPAEWAPHTRCWMAWPCRESLWGSDMAAARRAFATVAQAIARFEPVTMLAPPASVKDAAALCGVGVETAPMALVDSWTRDTGPTFICDDKGAVAGCDWRFNGWGGKENPHDSDAAMAASVLARLGLKRFDAPVILEGGAVHVDGEGTLITTDSVLLNDNRNPGISRSAMEDVLQDYLGVQKIIWLAGGLAGDMTDGHVDNVACFARPGIVLAAVCDDPTDPNYEVLRENQRILNAARDAKGRSLSVLTLPQPRPKSSDVLAHSYVNFYIANTGVVAPSFGDVQDREALAVIENAFPERTVVQVDARVIVKGGGGIHCITQQQPCSRKMT